jgi:hypothetical protein
MEGNGGESEIGREEGVWEGGEREREIDLGN